MESKRMSLAKQQAGGWWEIWDPRGENFILLFAAGKRLFWNPGLRWDLSGAQAGTVQAHPLWASGCLLYTPSSDQISPSLIAAPPSLPCRQTWCTAIAPPFITPSTLCSRIPFSVSSIWGCRLTESCDTRNRFRMTHQEPSTHWRIGNTFLTLFQGKRSHLLLYTRSKRCLIGLSSATCLAAKLLIYLSSKLLDPWCVHL